MSCDHRCRSYGVPQSHQLAWPDCPVDEAWDLEIFQRFFFERGKILPVHRPACPAREKHFLPAENAVGPADRSLRRAQLLRWELGHFSKHLAGRGRGSSSGPWRTTAAILLPKCRYRVGPSGQINLTGQLPLSCRRRYENPPRKDQTARSMRQFGVTKNAITRSPVTPATSSKNLLDQLTGPKTTRYFNRTASCRKRAGFAENRLKSGHFGRWGSLASPKNAITRPPVTPATSSKNLRDQLTGPKTTGYLNRTASCRKRAGFAENRLKSGHFGRNGHTSMEPECRSAGYCRILPDKTVRDASQSLWASLPGANAEPLGLQRR